MANDQYTIVVGLGITGLSVARFLRREQRPFILMDSRNSPPSQSVIAAEFSDVPCITGGLDVGLLKKADEIIISPGLSLQTPAIKQAIANGVKVISDIELFAQYHSKQGAAPIVAITGSNGKSTVTTLVGQMARDAGIVVAVGGNIGTPALELLMVDKKIELYVLELSSFQLETIYSLHTEVATVLNVSTDHMDRYDSLQAYALIKQRIYRNTKWSVINRQDPLTQPLHSGDVSTLSFGLNEPDANGFGLSIVDSIKFLTYRSELLMPVTDLFLQAGHNYANVLAALAIGSALNIPIESMLSTVKIFRGLRHRCEYVLTHKQITYINDSKGTNVGATQAAIKSLGHERIKQGRKIVLIVGGDGKNADFSLLLPVFKRYLRALIVMGKDADKLFTVVDNIIPCEHVHSIFSAVTAAQNYALTGDLVLLSPACSSFDMFTGFEDRGDQFVRAVHEVAA